MIALLTNIIPIALGFFAKLSAIKSQSNSDYQKLVIETLSAKNKNINSAREFSKTESKSAQWFRRSVVFILLSFVSFYIAAPFFGIDLVIQTNKTTSYLFGLIEFSYPGFKTISGLFKFDEIFSWVTMIIEFYFGGQLAKGK
jgi:hypothetical protein